MAFPVGSNSFDLLTLVSGRPLAKVRGRMNSTPQALQLPSAHPERPVHFTHRVSRPRTCKPLTLLGLPRLQRGQPRKLGSSEEYGAFEARGVRRLVMDEFALHKGHRYATVIMDAQCMRVLWVGEGNSREAIRPFFELLGKEGCRHIEAVSMDMNTAFDLEVRAHCPNAEVVYDLFHVVARFGREVVDRVRNALRSEPAQRQVIRLSPENGDQGNRVRPERARRGAKMEGLVPTDDRQWYRAGDCLCQTTAQIPARNPCLRN